MTRKVDIKNEHIVKDLRAILFDNDDELREYQGYKPTDDARSYISNIAVESFYAGAHRVIDELNRQADREASQAQTRAIKKLMKYGGNK